MQKRMQKQRQNGRGWMVLLGLTLASSGASRGAWAMEGGYGKGDPKHPIGFPVWLPSVSLVANRTDRVRGNWVNDSTCGFL